MIKNKGMMLILERYEDDDYKMQDGLNLEIDTHLPKLTRSNMFTWLEDLGVVFQTENSETSQVRDKPEGIIRDE